MKPTLQFDCNAIIQRGYAIFGVGETEDDALEDAEQWLDKDSDRSYGTNHGDLASVPCTRALMERVLAEGTLTWSAPGRDDDGICLTEELEDD